MASTHSIYIPKSGVPTGLSEWDIPLRGRTRLPQERHIRLETPAKVKRWAKRFPDVPAWQVEHALATLNPSQP